MVSAPPKPKPPAIQRDRRLLEPGWPGEPSPDELEFLQAELSRDNKLAFQWGFQPRKKRRPEWAVRQVAMWGDPDLRKINMDLARKPLNSPLEGAN